MVSRFNTTQCEGPESYDSDSGIGAMTWFAAIPGSAGSPARAGCVLFLNPPPLVGGGRHDVGGDRDERRISTVEVVLGRVEQCNDPTKRSYSHSAMG